MDIKPLYETGTITMVNPTISKVTELAEVKKFKSEYDNIPNGISKVIHWEKLRQLFTLGLNAISALSMIILIILFIKVFDSSWLALVLPSLVATFSTYKFFSTLLERKYLLNSIKRYSDDLKIGITSTPAFIAKMYKALIKKQIRHNWFTFFTMFYGGLATLLLWWLKDSSWWIFKFDKWIHAWFSNPDMMTWLFACALLLITVSHMVLAIQRKRRLLEIDSYFGEQIMPQTDIDSIKTTENKMFRRLFIISLMVFLIIPIVIKIVNRILRKK